MTVEREIAVCGLRVTLTLDTNTLEYAATVSGRYIGHGDTWQDAVNEAIDAYVEAESVAVA
jgi:hypothetical protein